MFWKNLFSAKKLAAPQTYGLPEGELVYAVGDIHGRVDLLVKLLDLIKADMASRTFERGTIVFLGDYIDRGFHSKEVIDRLIAMKALARSPGTNVVCLAGNHEDMMVKFLDDPAEGQRWLGVGGLATLASYGVMVEEESDFDALHEASKALEAALPHAHLEFLKGLGEHFLLGDVLFVHAGLRPEVPFKAQTRRDKLGIRGEFTRSDFDFGVKIVHGHTGVRSAIVAPQRVAVDTGAFATGILTAAVMVDTDVALLCT